MASTPPVVHWYKWDPTGGPDGSGGFIDPVPYRWDAGIVEAGGFSPDDGNNEFFVWNNYDNATDDVANMINVRISVKDEQGTDVDKKVCGSDGDPGKQASVGYLMWNDLKGSGGQWGWYDQNGTWKTPDTDGWGPLTSAQPLPITQASGKSAVTSTGGTVSGGKNTASKDLNKDNYIYLKLQITAKGNADAGTVKWINRISYQYT